ncbi:Transcriptional regulator, LacI family [Nostocoides japonicum T1-X7]|uniref:Transcriptional regulator, LacI family n=2 Tax=Nostocoides japonicum TaxID=99481 RepID=A0A077LY88_9MICO|nr:Transcriptional regulator, LacI family [Tetrasphaera japonica T1-X7]
MATAARALGGYGSVSAAAKERVAQAAKTLGYRPNVVARSMITGRTNAIGVVLADIENAFFSSAVRGIADAARAAGQHVILANTDEDIEKEHAAIRVFVERRVDGLIVCPTDGTDRTYLRGIIEQGTPVVLLDRRIRGLRADSVGIDNHRAAYEATRYLLAAGHERIGVVTGTASDVEAALHRPGLVGVENLVGMTGGERTAGYRDALLQAGIEPRVDYVVSGGGYRREDAVAATKELMALEEPPTAILPLDSILSLGVLQAVRELGLRCPRDVSVVGFDDAEWTETVTPPLTVVAQPVQEIGARALQRLLSRIDGSRQRPVHETLETTLVERESVGPPLSEG